MATRAAASLAAASRTAPAVAISITSPSKPPSAPKGLFAKFGFFEAAILCIFKELLKRDLRTSEELV